jgi:site-specific DNA recombinase
MRGIRRRLFDALARADPGDGQDAMVKDPAADIGMIVKRENLAERHVRFLAPLAYLSPRIIEAIAEGRAPADLTVTRLVRNLPTVWADQEKQLGFG